MSGMIYLRRVIALVDEEKYRKDSKLLGERLETRGICFYDMQYIEERGILINGQQEVSVQGIMDTVSFEQGKPEWEGCGLGQENSACLWITDRADWAEVLLKGERAVLVYLHEDNRQQNFSKMRYACENLSELDVDYLEGVYRRYQMLPWDILETDRCYIRETTEADVPAFYAIYEETDITRYMEGLFQEVEQELQYIKDYREKVYDFYGFGVWTVLKKNTGEVIGRAGLSYREGFEVPELGFVIGVPWQQQGFAEEVCRAILQYAKEVLEFDTVQAFVMPENTASAHLCEKLGFRRVEQVQLAGKKYDRFSVQISGF